MSEEYGLKFVVNGEDYDKIKKSLNEQIEDLQQKVEQLESIRKEIKEYIEKNVVCCKNSDMLVELNVYDLLNILNKGSENDVKKDNTYNN